jgi:sulfane dehydrogenase subunit SoxC
MDAKSVITSPSPQSPITHGQGPLVITGLAWSGRGHHHGRVDVSLDGGKNWQEARLAAPKRRQGADRFYLDINWDGSEMLAAVARPRRYRLCPADQGQLREVRGDNSIYHNNGIQTWWVRNERGGGKC